MASAARFADGPVLVTSHPRSRPSLASARIHPWTGPRQAPTVLGSASACVLLPCTLDDNQHPSMPGRSGRWNVQPMFRRVDTQLLRQHRSRGGDELQRSLKKNHPHGYRHLFGKLHMRACVSITESFSTTDDYLSFSFIGPVPVSASFFSRNNTRQSILNRSSWFWLFIRTEFAVTGRI